MPDSTLLTAMEEIKSILLKHQYALDTDANRTICTKD